MNKTTGPLLRLVEELVGLRLSGLFSDPERETDESAERGGWIARPADGGCAGEPVCLVESERENGSWPP